MTLRRCVRTSGCGPSSSGYALLQLPLVPPPLLHHLLRYVLCKCALIHRCLINSVLSAHRAVARIHVRVRRCSRRCHSSASTRVGGSDRTRRPHVLYQPQRPHDLVGLTGAAGPSSRMGVGNGARRPHILHQPQRPHHLVDTSDRRRRRRRRRRTFCWRRWRASVRVPVRL